MRAAIDEAGPSDQRMERQDALSPGHCRDSGDAGRLPRLSPSLLEGPAEALSAYVAEFDLWVAIGLPENLPSPRHHGASVDFGHNSAVHREGAFGHLGIAFKFRA